MDEKFWRAEKMEGKIRQRRLDLVSESTAFMLDFVKIHTLYGHDVHFTVRLSKYALEFIYQLPQLDIQCIGSHLLQLRIPRVPLVQIVF